ncbi:MAG TPA: hypothetical protein H9902_09525 [Candidatus Stackebrandtia faecavium]|nr:hypothetical protein [Candidatus Stackebrandtia faecavium]
MSEPTKVQKDALIHFANFADEQWGALEPWASSNAEDFQPPDAAFGSATSKTSDISFKFHLMTPAEYEKETGNTLDPASDPGPGVANNLGSTTIDVAGFIDDYGWASISGAGAIVKGITEATDTGSDSWFKYYAARGPDQYKIVQPGEYDPHDAPWAQPLIDGWKSAVTNRLSEVDDVRNEIAFLVPILCDAAKDYVDVDIANALDLDDYALLYEVRTNGNPSDIDMLSFE